MKRVCLMRWRRYSHSRPAGRYSKQDAAAVHVPAVVPAKRTLRAPRYRSTLRCSSRGCGSVSTTTTSPCCIRIGVSIYFAGARWSGPLDEVVQDLALQAFRARANLRNVHADASAFGSGYWLEIDVADFQAEYSARRSAAAPTVHVHLLGTRSAVPAIGAFSASSTQTNGNRPRTTDWTAIVEAYNQAADTALAAHRRRYHEARERKPRTPLAQGLPAGDIANSESASRPHSRA